MQCPFCHGANAATARACRVCGGPLRAEKPKIRPVSIVAPTPKLSELARQTFDEKALHLMFADFLSDEKPIIVLVRESGEVQLWNARNNKNFSFSIGRIFRKSGAICCATLAPNLIAMGHECGQVRLHSLDGRQLKSPQSHVGRVVAVAATLTQLYSGGSDGAIWITKFCGKKNEKSWPLLDGLGAMTTLAIAPEGACLAVGCDDGAVQLWRLNADQTSAKLDWTRRGHNAPIRSLSFSANGQMLVSRDKENRVCLWAAQTSYQLPLSAGAQSSHVAPAFASDSRLLALLNPQKGVAVFDVALGNLLYELPRSNEAVTHLAFASHEPWLMSAGAREIVVWEIG